MTANLVSNKQAHLGLSSETSFVEIGLGYPMLQLIDLFLLAKWVIMRCCCYFLPSGPMLNDAVDQS